MGDKYIDRFRIQSLLGRGSMGVVYLVVDEQSGRPFALKQITRVDESQLLRFKREFRAMQRLDHPNLVRVFDYGQTEDLPYFTMEYVDGFGLADYVQHGSAGPPAGGALDGIRSPAAAPEPPTVRQIGRLVHAIAHVCRPLAYIHARRVLHRDLKPSNIMILRAEHAGLEDRVKLMDFSLAKEQAGGPSIDPEITVAGSLIGTPAYISPEQALGEAVDARSDLYALGVVLFELAAGRRPFDATSAFLTVLKHLNEQPVSARILNPAIPPALAEIIELLLRKDPSERVQSAAELESRLLRITGLVDTEEAAPAPPVLVRGRPIPSWDAETTPNIPWSVIREAMATGGQEHADALVDSGAGQRQAPALYSPRFVGREREQTVLAARVAELRGGVGSFVVVSGEAGVGKTRLARELRRDLRLGKIPAFAAACTEAASTPLGVFGGIVEQVVESCLAVADGAIPAEIVSPLLVLGQHCPEIRRLPPLRAQPTPEPLPPGQAKFRVLDALHRVLAWASNRSPLALLIDNLQWIDQLSLEALEYFVRRGIHRPPDQAAADDPPLAVMIVACVRSEEIAEVEALSKSLQRLVGEGVAVPLPLERLEVSSIRALLASMLGMADPPADFVRRVHAETDGNPFFVEEIVKELVAERIVVPNTGGGSWGIGPAEAGASPLTASDFDRIRIPVTIREALQRRLSRLSPELLEVLTVAAVIGSEFSFDVLSACTRWDEDPLLDAVDELLRRAILAEVVGTSERYRFHHEKVREVLYRDCPQRRRTRLHRRVAEALEARGDAAGEQRPNELARHYLMGKNRPKAIHYALTAARVDAAMFANEQALEQYANALSLLQKPEGSDEEAQRIRVLLERGDVLKLIGSYAEARDAFAEALDGARCGLLPAETAAAMLGLCESYWRQGAHRVALEFGKEALEQARQDNNPRAIAAALTAIFPIHFYLGQIDDARSVMQEAIAMDPAPGNPAERADRVGRLATLAHRLAEYDRAREYYLQSIRLAKQSNNKVRIAANLSNLSALYFDLGRYGRALKHCRRGLELDREIGNRPGLALGYAHLGAIYATIGMYDKGAKTLVRSVRISDETGERVFLPYALVMLARVWRALGEADGAREALMRAYRLSGESGNPEDGLHAGLEVVRVMAQQGRLDAARKKAEELKNTAATLSNPLLHAAAIHLCARLDGLLKRPEQALNAARIAADMRVKHQLGEAWSSYVVAAESLQALGQLDEAKAAAARALSLLGECIGELPANLQEVAANRRGVQRLGSLYQELTGAEIDLQHLLRERR
ncbi:MAG: protein kinase [Candidatus Schekmanbacteria bacterium]|nr:protein kinase [Candidatus Schekmanbacteria bacterium]